MGNKDSKKFVPISTELTPKQIALLKVNTKFTEGEIQQWHRKFIHDCPTGRLDKKHFTEIYKQFCPDGDATSTCAYAFNAFDINNDGSIDFNEFLLATAAASQGDLDDRLEYAFDVYDVSNDGQIDQKELSDMIQAIYDLTGATDHSGKNDPKKRASEIIAKLDTNGDNKLSKPEFIIGLISCCDIWSNCFVFTRRDFGFQRYENLLQDEDGSLVIGHVNGHRSVRNSHSIPSNSESGEDGEILFTSNINKPLLSSKSIFV